jgi:hypothetical protein
MFVRWLPESCGYVRRYRVGAKNTGTKSFAGRRE